jgi:ADP-heptose:LPS heptosyltransferase
MKFLIIQTSYIGDVILATALVEKLATHFPDAQIDFLLSKGKKEILANNPHLKQVIEFDKQKKLSSFLKTIKTLRSAKYDYAINIHRFFSSGLLCAFSKAKNKIGFKKNPLSFLFSLRIDHHIDATGNVHETERNQKLIEHLTNHQAAKPRLYPSEEDVAIVTKKKDYVCMAPASVWFTKQLPAGKWVELTNSFTSKVDIYLIGSQADFQLCEHIIQQSQREGIYNMAGQLSIMQSAAFMSRAKMNYVNDSAPLHIASAMNAPQTAFFLSTVPEFGFGPLSDQSYILACDQAPDCRPCGLHGKKACPEIHFKCADIAIYKMETF